jgi:uncharacterized protein (TIGR03435 family)
MVRVALLLLLAAVGAPCQPAIEAASIKPSNSVSGDSSMHGSPGQVTMENISLKQWIEVAFGLKDFTLAGPDWLESARFNVAVKMSSPPTTREQFATVLRTLLIERFKLVYHNESKVVPAYALVVDKKGLKLTASPEGEMKSNTSVGALARITATHATMEELADVLSEQLDRPVKDMTGITGAYDVKLVYAPETSATKENSTAASIFAALQEQAGLRLEGRKLPVKILVVDSIQRQPTEN